jgi:23S rRNA pseudouridine955/2504/2580 synthase
MKPPETAVRQVEVTPAQDGQRIDNFLGRTLKGVPRTHIYRLLRTGQVRINGRRAKADVRLQAGDRVRIPPVRTAPPRDAGAIPETVHSRLESAILVEDEHLIELDKPSGLAVHAGSGLRYGVIEALRAARPHAPMLELVHRLDRAISGCLLIAKSRPALTELHTALGEGAVRKGYRALLCGHWRGGAREVDVPLERGAGGAGPSVRVDAEGKHAWTRFQPEERFAEATLVSVQIATGRTHQIRVHAAHIAHPVAGDDKYGDFAANRRFRALGLRRLFLHAARLEFHLPCAGRAYALQAPLPEDLEAVLRALRS